MIDDFNYDVHGLIRISSNRDLSLIDRRLSYFRVNTTIPNFTIKIIKDFNLKGIEAVRIIPDIFGVSKGEWIYYDKSLAGLKLKLLVKRLLDETEVIATNSFLKLHIKIGRITPLWEIIPFIMDIKLLNEGYTFVHGACLSKKGKGVLICAFPNTGKTLTALLGLKKEHGFSYLSDDIIIVDEKGYAYCYPDPHPIFNIKGEIINRRDYVKTILKLISPVIGFSAVEPIGQYTNIYKEIENPRIIQRTKIDNIFFLEREQESVEEISFKDAYNKLLISKRHEFPLYTDPIILGYSYFNPELNLEEIALREQKILLNLVESANKRFILRSKNPKKFIDLVESIV